MFPSYNWNNCFSERINLVPERPLLPDMVCFIQAGICRLDAVSHGALATNKIRLKLSPFYLVYEVRLYDLLFLLLFIYAMVYIALALLA